MLICSKYLSGEMETVVHSRKCGLENIRESGPWAFAILNGDSATTKNNQELFKQSLSANKF